MLAAVTVGVDDAAVTVEVTSAVPVGALAREEISGCEAWGGPGGSRPSSSLWGRGDRSEGA